MYEAVQGEELTTKKKEECLPIVVGVQGKQGKKFKVCYNSAISTRLQPILYVIRKLATGK